MAKHSKQGFRNCLTHIGERIIAKQEEQGFSSLPRPPPKSTHWNESIGVTFKNDAPHDVELMWTNYQGDPVSYGMIAPNKTLWMGTYATHPWSVEGMLVDGQKVWVPTKEDDERTIHITAPLPTTAWVQAKEHYDRGKTFYCLGTVYYAPWDYKFNEV